MHSLWPQADDLCFRAHIVDEINQGKDVLLRVLHVDDAALLGINREVDEDEGIAGKVLHELEDAVGRADANGRPLLSDKVDLLGELHVTGKQLGQGAYLQQLALLQHLQAALSRGTYHDHGESVGFA